MEFPRLRFSTLTTVLANTASAKVVTDTQPEQIADNVHEYYIIQFLCVSCHHKNYEYCVCSYFTVRK